MISVSMYHPLAADGVDLHVEGHRSGTPSQPVCLYKLTAPTSKPSAKAHIASGIKKRAQGQSSRVRDMFHVSEGNTTASIEALVSIQNTR